CNHDVIRYADVLLMQAEAKVKQGKVADGIALINRIRRRADPTGNILADIPVGSQEEAIQALISERQVELCGEQVRRMDLVRWGIAVEHLPGFQPGKNEYFPIPQSEVDNNEALNENNPGY
ncbi:MAG: RagB/SusD family nutrient uptake outer membrane protein, partial [Bacteroidota bacterium]